MNALPAAIKLGLALLVLLAYVFPPRRPVPLPVLLQHSDRQGWRIVFPNQEPQAVTLLPSSVLSRWLTILHLQLSNGNLQTLIIFNDALPGNDYRRLTVRLKLSSDSAMKKDDC